MAPLAGSPVLALFGDIGWAELLILAVIGVLIFGRRLPEVGKSLGKGIVEFKKGLSGIEDGIQQAGTPRDQEPGKLEAKDSDSSVHHSDTSSSHQAKSDAHGGKGGEGKSSA